MNNFIGYIDPRYDIHYWQLGTRNGRQVVFADGCHAPKRSYPCYSLSGSDIETHFNSGATFKDTFVDYDNGLLFAVQQVLIVDGDKAMVQLVGQDHIYQMEAKRPLYVLEGEISND